MATELTTPVAQPDKTHQGITRLEFLVPHKRNLADDGMIFDKDNISIRYEVTTWDLSGKVIELNTRTVPFSSWTAGFITDLRSVYATVETDARNNGLLGLGTDEPLET